MNKPFNEQVIQVLCALAALHAWAMNGNVTICNMQFISYTWQKWEREINEAREVMMSERECQLQKRQETERDLHLPEIAEKREDRHRAMCVPLKLQKREKYSYTADQLEDGVGCLAQERIQERLPSLQLLNQPSTQAKTKRFHSYFFSLSSSTCSTWTEGFQDFSFDLHPLNVFTVTY